MSWYLVKSLASSLRLLILSVTFLCGVAGSEARAQPAPSPGAPAKPAAPAPGGKDSGKEAGKEAGKEKDAKDAASAAADQQARAHFQRGQELANQGKYPQAYLEFEAGYRQSHRPLFLFNLGEAARAFGDAGRARAAYQRYLEEDPSGPMVSSAQSRLTDLGPGVATDLGLSKKDEGGDKPAPQISPLLLPPERFTTEEPKEQPSRPLWKKWPFWAAVGGVVAGGVAVYALTRDTSACGDGCTLVDLR
jgi:tetratricopeptide (TPR) repeat protein